MGTREIHILSSEQQVISTLCELIEKVANASIEKSGNFTVGLSGGSLSKFLSQGLPKISTDWSKWVFFFCDERVVPPGDNDSNFGSYVKTLIKAVPISENQFVNIESGLPVEECAKVYAARIKKHFPNVEWPRFNLLLLGMGEDGHTCSLFPGHSLLKEESIWVAPISDSPKPPPARVTLTFPVINHSEYCIFAMAGKGKAEMVKRILKDNEPLPAGLVKPKNGELHWILDSAAASLL